MEKDLKRGRGQWRGCYSFKDIICDGAEGGSPKRSGGLKMGQEYWYYVCSSCPMALHHADLISMSLAMELTFIIPLFHRLLNALTFLVNPSTLSGSLSKSHHHAPEAHLPVQPVHLLALL
jgi:hypothetical protein